MNITKALLFLSLTILTIFSLSTAKESNKTISKTKSHGLDYLLNQISQWRKDQTEAQNKISNPNFNIIVAWILCFLAASVSSAGGVGGGSLFLPILTLISGLSLKTATAFTAFMVTGGSLSNILYTLLFMSKSLINYEIALLSQPCLLLGVSIGVVCDVISPEWLITGLFAIFLACSTVKTCQSGFKFWKAETEEVRIRAELEGRENGGERRRERMKEPLLGEERESGVPWKDIVVLVMVWLCFFVLHIFIGDKDGKGVINIKPCGVTYWLITLSQIPFAIAFTCYILYVKRKEQQRDDEQGNQKVSEIKNKIQTLPVFVFPVAALLTGVMSGLFGIGGGLLINPLFLQIGVPPQIAAATATFMVLFSASMSMVQYILLGVRGIDQALVYAIICFVASIVGLIIVQRAIQQSGRVSLVVFVVSIVMALSTVIITLFGVIDVWRQYTSGDYMGFKLPC